ncbi:type VI secretion system tube protein TssD [Lacinutrix sp. 5H-3-7-4]|uniref:type VI secretion system tube protein TssD n=1 Tax=Lacinutrix sp. (strain 5H-3-7-4) TaxID=983544 RepID=UPI00020A3902|nr:type VI secretion system tube protein TssD [Lacinutrix sp. 5H-3-7-4]AEH02102.1 hypothetical protein Lacal_2259 [Lacinutrix sp. 5H-3-7-4]
MSFLAKLTIDDQEFNVLSFSFDVNQQVNHGSARPTGLAIINHIHISIESAENSGFFGWSVNSYEQKDGEIVFYKRDAMASSRTLKFTGAFCVNYNEVFQSNSANPMITNLVLTVETLELDDTLYINPSIKNL